MSEVTRLTPDELVTRLATMANVTEQQVRALLQAQAELASQYARVNFAVPGIGVMRLIDRPARRGIVPAGPDKGKPIEFPALKVVKFRVCKMMKDVVFGSPENMPDIFDPAIFDITWYPPDYEQED